MFSAEKKFFDSSCHAESGFHRRYILEMISAIATPAQSKPWQIHYWEKNMVPSRRVWCKHSAYCIGAKTSEGNLRVQKLGKSCGWSLSRWLALGVVLCGWCLPSYHSTVTHFGLVPRVETCHLLLEIETEQISERYSPKSEECATSKIPYR